MIPSFDARILLDVARVAVMPISRSRASVASPGWIGLPASDGEASLGFSCSHMCSNLEHYTNVFAQALAEEQGPCKPAVEKEVSSGFMGICHSPTCFIQSHRWPVLM
jgi:hypothetical protein